MIMAKKEKEEKAVKSDDFDLDKALEECPKPDWYKKAFVKVMDTSKIKNQNDLIKAFKTYGEMK